METREKITIETLYKRNGTTLKFVPIKNVPGFSHRVIINEKMADWLSSAVRPGKKHAEYFLKKHNA
jgi:hypothetical protein